MSRRLPLVLLLLFALLLLQSAPAPPAAAQAPAPTEKVNCTKGESVNKALAKHPAAAALVVEITGMCHENVVVRRDRVTLRGTDPDADGIDAVANAGETDAAVWVRDAQLVTIENLRLTGGFTGLLASNVGVPFLRLKNCRLEGNSQWGAQLELALVEAVDTTFGPNTRFSVGVFNGSRFVCSGCTFTLPPAPTPPLPPGTALDNIIAFGGSQVILFESALVNGGVNSNNSTVSINDSTVEAFPGAAAVIAFASSAVTLVRTPVEGTLRFNTGTTAGLFGVTQTAGSPFAPNSADDMSFVRVGDAFPPCTASPCPPGPVTPSDLISFSLGNFSNLSLLNTSKVSGSINCVLGAAAVCPTSANITGTANCGLCAK